MPELIDPFAHHPELRDRIADTGPGQPPESHVATAERVIDAKNLAVLPGFVDGTVGGNAAPGRAVADNDGDGRRDILTCRRGARVPPTATRSVAKNTFLLTSGLMLGRVLALFVTKKMTPVLGPDGMGIWFLANDITVILLTVTNFGLGVLLTREVTRSPEQSWPQLWAALRLRWLTILLAAAVFVLALGKMVGETFSQTAVVAVFFGAGIAGALAYGLLLDNPYPLLGGYPGAYGLIALESEGIGSWSDLAGKNVWNGPPRGAALVNARQAIAAVADPFSNNSQSAHHRAPSDRISARMP